MHTHPSLKSSFFFSDTPDERFQCFWYLIISIYTSYARHLIRTKKGSITRENLNFREKKEKTEERNSHPRFIFLILETPFSQPCCLELRPSTTCSSRGVWTACSSHHLLHWHRRSHLSGRYSSCISSVLLRSPSCVIMTDRGEREKKEKEKEKTCMEMEHPR